VNAALEVNGLRLLFLGSPDFAVPSLRALSAAGHVVALVVTQPDRSRGRGRHPAPTAVKQAALALGLEVFQPESANAPESVQMLRGVNAELGVVVAYGEILSPGLLSVTERGFINAHASLLPDYRGAAPVNWAVIRGERVTGVSIIRVEPQLDAGPILASRQVEIAPDETAGELHDRLAAVAAEAVVDVVDRMAAGEEMPGRPQPREAGFFARKLTKGDGRIEWSLSARDLGCRVRGLNPWPGAYSDLHCAEGSVCVALLRVEEAGPCGRGGEPGTVLCASDEDGLVVQAGQGAVRILELKPAGSRAMTAADFIHGHRVQPGDRFH